MWNKYARLLLESGADIEWFRALENGPARSTTSGLNNGQLRVLRERGILKRVANFSSGAGSKWSTGPNYKFFMKRLEKYDKGRRQI